DEVGKVLLRELLIQSARHDRYRAGGELLEVLPSNPHLLGGAQDENQFVGPVLLQNSLEGPAVERDCLHGLVAAYEACAREDNRFQQVLLAAYAADARQVGSDLAAEITHLVASDAGSFRTIEHLLAAADVAGG